MKKALKFLNITSITALGAMLLFGVNGMAYIDPSVMTYLIQAIAGVVISVSAVLTIYIRKAKKKVCEKLGIDENRGKEVESDELLITDEAATTETAATEAAATEAAATEATATEATTETTEAATEKQEETASESAAK